MGEMSTDLLRLAALLAGGICVFAGGELALSDTVDADSYLAVIADGLGIYMIGKGVFVFALLYMHAGEIDARRARESPPSSPEDARGAEADARQAG